MNFLRTVAQKALKITDKSVDVAFASCFEDDVLVIVVPQSSGELFIIHLWLVFPDSPSPGHFVGISHFEFPTIACPGDEMLATLVGEELKQKLPQLNWA